MNILYTPADILDFNSVEIEVITSEQPNLSGVSIKYRKDDKETTIFICAQSIFDATGETSFKDFSTYYVTLVPNGINIINKFAETFYTKQTGIQYIRANNMLVPVQIYVPFAASDLSEATIRVAGPGVPLLNGEKMSVDKEVPATQEAFTKCLWSLLPSIVSPETSTSPINVQLTLNGLPLRRSGVGIVGKVSGELIVTTNLTDENGVASFAAAPGSTIEFGFRYYSNITRTKVI